MASAARSEICCAVTDVTSISNGSGASAGRSPCSSRTTRASTGASAAKCSNPARPKEPPRKRPTGWATLGSAGSTSTPPEAASSRTARPSSTRRKTPSCQRLTGSGPNALKRSSVRPKSNGCGISTTTPGTLAARDLRARRRCSRGKRIREERRDSALSRGGRVGTRHLALTIRATIRRRSIRSCTSAAAREVPRLPAAELSALRDVHDEPGGLFLGEHVCVHHEVVVGRQLVLEAVEALEVVSPGGVRLLDSLGGVTLAKARRGDAPCPRLPRGRDEHAQHPLPARRPPPP